MMKWVISSLLAVSIVFGILGFSWYYIWGTPSYSAENPGIRGSSIEGVLIDLRLSELVKSADLIIIGEVGPVVAKDYPRKYQLEDVTPAKLSDYGGDEYIYGLRDKYHSIIVEETIRGDDTDPFVLVRPDVDYYNKIDLSRLSQGDRILLFGVKFHDVEYITNQFEEVYWSLGDNAIFDIDSQNRAFPRNPGAFMNVPTEETSVSRDTIPELGSTTSTIPPYIGIPEDNLDLSTDEIDTNPYIQLEKIRIVIENVIERVGPRIGPPLESRLQL